MYKLVFKKNFFFKVSPMSHVTKCITMSLWTPENALHFEGNKGQVYQESEMTKSTNTVQFYFYEVPSSQSHRNRRCNGLNSRSKGEFLFDGHGVRV